MLNIYCCTLYRLQDHLDVKEGTLDTDMEKQFKASYCHKYCILKKLETPPKNYLSQFNADARTNLKSRIILCRNDSSWIRNYLFGI